MQVTFKSRNDGEKPVLTKIMHGVEKPAANVVKIVVYRADVLAADDGRSTDAEWEIVAILAQDEENVPMNPSTMLRNANHDEGGTLRTYSDQEWIDAYAYWENHAFISS